MPESQHAHSVQAYINIMCSIYMQGKFLHAQLLVVDKFCPFK